MNGVTVTAHDIYKNIRHLPPERLMDLAEYVEFLRFKTATNENLSATEKPSEPAIPDEFENAVAVFDRLKPDLMAKYGGRVVAIYQDKVVAVGDDKMSVLETVVQTLGPVPCYIEWVEPETPRRVRMPSAWVAA